MQIEQAREGLKEVSIGGASANGPGGQVDARCDLLDAIKKGISCLSNILDWCPCIIDHEIMFLAVRDSRQLGISMYLFMRGEHVHK